MVVKSKRGRRRYIYFRVPRDVRRDGLAESLEGIASVKVITCHGGEAVVRCSPADRPDIESRLKSKGPEYRPVKTSGTLRTLRAEYPSLAVMQRRRR